MVYGERAAASRQDPPAWCFNLRAKRSARHFEAAKDRSIGAFAEADHHSGPDNLDLPTKKLRAIVEPGWLNFSLRPTVRTLQAKNRIREERDIAADHGTRISDGDTRGADELHEC